MLSHEKAGDVVDLRGPGIHYKRALEIDPRHRGAHEYIGEAYLMTGDLAGAQRHLDLLRGICLLGCEQLTDLERAVAEYGKKR